MGLRSHGALATPEGHPSGGAGLPSTPQERPLTDFHGRPTLMTQAFPRRFPEQSQVPVVQMPCLKQRSAWFRGISPVEATMWSDATWHDETLTGEAITTEVPAGPATFLGLLFSIVRGAFSPVILLVALVAALGSLSSGCNPAKVHDRTTEGVVFLLAVIAVVPAGVLTSAVSKGCSYLVPSTRPRTVFLIALARAAVGLFWIVPVALLVTQPGSTWTILVWALTAAGSVGAALVVAWVSARRRSSLRVLSTTSAAVGLGGAMVAIIVFVGPAHGSFKYYTTCSTTTLNLSTDSWVCVNDRSSASP